MKIRLSFMAVLAASAINTSPSLAAGDIAKGEALSQTCLGCHGVPGLRNPSPVYRVPMIGGQKAVYLETALKAYKNKTRSHPTMRAQAANLSDENIKDISAYFESLKQESKPFSKSGAAAGEKIFNEIDKDSKVGCVTCHGTGGRASIDEAKPDGTSLTEKEAEAIKETPSLAGQYDDYLQRVLLDYKSGARVSIMNGFASNLSKNDIKALSRWLRSKKGILNAPVIKSKK